VYGCSEGVAIAHGFDHGRRMESSHPVEETVVIGAGLAGLTVAYHLRDQGIDPLVLDRGALLGSSWRGRHPQLTLNTHRSISHLPALRYPEKTPAFPRRDDVVRHLEDFALKHRFRVRSGVNVLSISQQAAAFKLETGEGVIVARSVVVATGRDSRPIEPLIDGIETFTGERLHASEFGDAKRYAGRRILVIGGGNSGFDIVNHLARVPETRTWLSIRSGSAVLPKRLRGIAVHRLSPLMDLLPARMSDLAIALTQRLAFGDVRKFGLPGSPKGAATRLRDEHVAIPVDDGAIRSIREGKAQTVPEVVSVDRARVRLKSGDVIEPDSIILATGYSADLGKLLVDLGATDTKGNPILERDRVSCSIPGLFFAGMTPGLVSYFRNAHREGRAIARTVAKRSQA